MDVLTHAFVPFAAFTLAKRPKLERVAALVGGFSPDIDTLWAWASHLDPWAYPLVHRGFSHTFWGAPLLAALVWSLLSWPRLHQWWRKTALIRWDRSMVPALVIGAWTHLVLDGLTITGTPALWPLDSGRYTMNWFFFGVTYLMPVSLVALVKLLRGTASDRFVKGSALLLLGLLLVAGAIRAYSFPRDLDGGEDVTPGPLDWRWYVSERNETGVRVYQTGWGGALAGETFLPEPNRTQAAAAISACEKHPGYVPFRWSLWGHAVTNATRTEEGGWRIRYDDSAKILSSRVPDFRLWRSPARESSEAEGALCLVDASGKAVFQRERGWVGS